MTDAPSPEPGWHPDPWNEAPWRWWDGREWTGYVRLQPSAPNGPVGRVPRGFADAVGICFAKYANFAGRGTRSEFWYFVLFIVLGAFASGLTDGALSTSPNDEPLLFYLWFWVVALPFLAASVRRLHDTGRSGWWVLLSIVPFGGFFVLIFLALKTQPSVNGYGPPPGSGEASAPPEPRPSDETTPVSLSRSTEEPAGSAPAPEGGGNVDRPRRRWLPAALVVAIVLIALGDMFWRNMTLDAVVTAVEQSERSMHAANDEWDRIISRETSTQDEFESAVEEISATAAVAERDVREANALLAEVFVPPWQRSIVRVRATYFDHSQSWIERYEGVRADVAELFEPSPRIGATFTTTCRAHRAAVPAVDLYNLGTRIKNVCES